MIDAEREPHSTAISSGNSKGGPFAEMQRGKAIRERRNRKDNLAVAITPASFLDITLHAY